MTAPLHAALVAALNAEEESVRRACNEVSADAATANSWRWVRTALRRVAADRRVLARHSASDEAGPWCPWCPVEFWPCPDVIDLAARYDIKVTP